ncbi:MAG: PaaI family thioesterase [Muribaculaceae bacterium]|nr:PaaI family thioesterase [Muribaculaceae bacterium]
MARYGKIRNPWVGKDDYNCIGCAPNNPIGLHMHFYTDDDAVLGVMHPNENFQGWIGMLHGGIQSTMLDETGAWFVGYRKQMTAVTTRLDVRFMKPVLTSWERILVRATGGTEGHGLCQVHLELLSPDGEVCARAEATYFMNPRPLQDDSLRVRYDIEAEYDALP